MKLLLIIALCFASLILHAERTLDFDQALNEIFSHHPSAQKARATYEATLSRAMPGTFSAFPTLSIGATRNWDGVNTPTPTHSSFYGLQGTFNIFHGGSDYFAFKASLFLKRQAEADLQSAELLVEGEIVKNLFLYISQTQVVEIAKARLETKQSVLKVAQARFNRGLISAQESEKLSIEVSQANAQVSDLERSLLEINSQIKAYLPDANIVAEWPWEKSISEPRLIDKLPKPGINQRPDYRSAELAIELSESLRAKARGAMLPSIDLTSTYGRFQTAPSPSWYTDLTLGVTISLPLFDQLKTYSAYREQLYVAQAAEADREIKRRLGESSQESTFSSLKIARNSALERVQILDRSKFLFKNSLSLFRGGRINVNDLGLDEDRWLLSRNLAVQGWASVHQAFLDYCQARGLRVGPCFQK